uniref:Putative secreted protein n=1 Tax=Anopheles darlingi TaxID=43151 RepID=A0A2M4DI27_ANODA
MRCNKLSNMLPDSFSLLIFLMIVLSAPKSGRSVGSSDQHFIIMLLTSSYDDSSTLGRKGTPSRPGPSLTSLIISLGDFSSVPR